MLLYICGLGKGNINKVFLHTPAPLKLYVGFHRRLTVRFLQGSKLAA